MYVYVCLEVFVRFVCCQSAFWCGQDVYPYMFIVSPKHTARRVWKNYFPAIDAIVFIVDAYARDRFEEAKLEIDVSL